MVGTKVSVGGRGDGVGVFKYGGKVASVVNASILLNVTTIILSLSSRTN
jgi:hypothetical protein